MSDDSDDNIVEPAGEKTVKLNKKKVVIEIPFSGESYVFDTETTGTNDKKDRITEIAVVRFDPATGESFPDDPSKTFHRFVNPECEVPPEVVAVHGMTWEMLKQYPTIDQILPELIEFMRGHHLVAHNAPFDVRFINAELKRAGHKLTLSEIAYEVEDTCALSRQNVIAKKHKLDTLCDRYGIDRTKRILHDARGDCILLAEVYPALMADVKKNIEAISKVLPFSLGDITVDPTDIELAASRYLNIKTLVKILDKDAARYLEMVREQSQGADQPIGDEMEVSFTNTTKTNWDAIKKEVLSSVDDFDITAYQTQSSSIKVKFV